MSGGESYFCVVGPGPLGISLTLNDEFQLVLVSLSHCQPKVHANLTLVFTFVLSLLTYPDTFHT